MRFSRPFRYRKISNPKPVVIPPPAIEVSQMLRNFYKTGKLDAFVEPEDSFDFADEDAATKGIRDDLPQSMSRYEAAAKLHEQNPNVSKGSDVSQAPSTEAEPSAPAPITSSDDA